MKRTLLTILLACCMLASCATPLNNVSPQPLPDAADSAAALPAEGTIGRIAQYLNDKDATLRIRCGILEDGQTISVTPQLRAQIADEFVANSAQEASGPPSAAAGDREQPIELYFEKDGEWLRVTLHLTSPDAPEYPDMLYCEAESGAGKTGAYYFNRSVYDSIRRQIENNINAADPGEDESGQPAPLAKMIRYLEDEKIELDVECYIAYDRQYVNVTPELRAQIADLIRAGGAQERPEVRDVTLNQMESIKLMFTVQDAQLAVWLQMAQSDDPQSPDMLYCQIADDDGEAADYFFDKSVYTEIRRLVEKNFEKREIALEGDHVLLRPAQDGHYVDLQEVLEFDDRVVVAWESQTYAYSDLYCAVETFDLTDGKSISRYKTNEAVERMDKYTLLDGYDYRIFTSDAVTYKNSADPTAELRIALPENVTDTMASFYRYRGVGSFDIYKDTLVWVDKDGIQIAGADGANAKRLLDNSVLPEALQEKARDGAVFHYALPRLMCGGTKVAATIFREVPDDEVVSDGIAVCDIATGEMYWLNPGVPQIVREEYPVQGRYIASIRLNVTDLLDAQTGEITHRAITFDPSTFYSSFDYKTFIYNEMGHPYGFTAWVCDEADTADRSHTLLATVDDEMAGWISQATENYAFFTARDTEGVWVAAAKYTA